MSDLTRSGLLLLICGASGLVLSCGEPRTTFDATNPARGPGELVGNGVSHRATIADEIEATRDPTVEEVGDADRNHRGKRGPAHWVSVEAAPTQLLRGRGD